MATGICPFTFETAPGRVVFGSGTLQQLPEEAARLGLERLLVLSTPGHQDQAQGAAGLLQRRAAGLFSQATMHTPTEVTEAAMVVVREQRIDGLVAIGGGSVIGLGKAIALRTDLPQIVIPTTYAGSEMTALLGETQAGIKTTQKSPKVRPEVVIYDVDLTLSLPPAISATSGLNAIAHAVEALYAEDRNPIVSLIAEEGVKALFSALPRIVAEPSGTEARSMALYGAWLCGTCLGSVGMALHHKLCHVLGGAFNLPHAETHAILLPHVLAFNAPAAPEAMERLARAIGRPDPIRAFYDLQAICQVPSSLKAIGMPEDGVKRAADLATEKPFWNPRPVDSGAIQAVLAGAFDPEHGRRNPGEQDTSTLAIPRTSPS